MSLHGARAALGSAAMPCPAQSTDCAYAPALPGTPLSPFGIFPPQPWFFHCSAPPVLQEEEDGHAARAVCGAAAAGPALHHHSWPTEQK